MPIPTVMFLGHSFDQVFEVVFEWDYLDGSYGGFAGGSLGSITPRHYRGYQLNRVGSDWDRGHYRYTSIWFEGSLPQTFFKNVVNLETGQSLSTSDTQGLFYWNNGVVTAWDWDTIIFPRPAEDNLNKVFKIKLSV